MTEFDIHVSDFIRIYELSNHEPDSLIVLRLNVLELLHRFHYLVLHSLIV